MNKLQKKILVIGCLATILLGSLMQIQNNVVFTNELKSQIRVDGKGVQNEYKNDTPSQNSLNDEENPIFPPKFWELLCNLDADEWGYKEWKKYVIVDFSNHTEEEFYQNAMDDPEVNYILNVLIRLFWGTYNSSLSEEESRILRSKLTHQTTQIRNQNIQYDESKISIDIVYSVRSVWWWCDIADALEVRFRIKYDSTSPYFTRPGWLNHKYHDNIPDPSTVYIVGEGWDDYLDVYPDFRYYPMESGKRVFHKILHTADTNVWDNHPTWYYEHIDIPTGNEISYPLYNLYVHAILTYGNRLFCMAPVSMHETHSVSWCISLTDDDTTSPDFIDFQACRVTGTIEDKEMGEKVYIYRNSIGMPINYHNILVRAHYSDVSGISNKWLQYRVKFWDGTVSAPQILNWDSSEDTFLIPARDYNPLLVNTIEIRSKARDADNDRGVIDNNCSLWTHELYDEWFVVAEVIEQELKIESLNTQYEYSNDKLKPFIEYDAYLGENISFSLKLVNGLNDFVQINEIKFATLPADSPTTPTYIIQQLKDFEISNHTTRTTPFFNKAGLLNQFNAIGNYKILIILNFSYLSNEFLLHIEDIFRVIEPEQPKIKFFIGYNKLDTLEFTQANFYPMFYKDDMLNKATKTIWNIKVENPSRLILKINESLKFNLNFINGRSPGKLQISTGNTIDISVNPFLTETYPFTLEITDPSVFPKGELGSDWLDLGIIDFINDLLGLGGACIDYINLFKEALETTSDVIGGIGLVFNIKSLVQNIWRGIETFTNLDMYNTFDFQCLNGGGISWNYISSEGQIKFSELYKNLINTTKLNFEVLIGPSEKQMSYIDEYFLTQGWIIGIDIALVASSAYALATGEPISKAVTAFISLGLFIEKEMLIYERDGAKEHCDDPEPPSGDYSKHVIKNYTEVTLPHEFENNLRYSACLYELFQNFENLNTEKKAQQEITNRLNNALEANESDWIIFQMSDLKESIELEKTFSINYLNALKKFNMLYFEDIVNLGVTNQDILYIEEYVEENGIPSQIKQIFNLTEEHEKQLIAHVANASEYKFIKDIDVDSEYSYTEYYKELDMRLDDLTKVKTEANDQIENQILKEYIHVSLKRGLISKELSETNITSLISLNHSITEKIMVKEWKNVIVLCDKLIELVNDLTFQIGNYSNPILVSFKYYAQTVKEEAIENNGKHLSLSSTAFNEYQALEPEMTGKAKFHIKLFNASSPNTVELNVHNLVGYYRFLNENGAVITQFTLLPNITSTIYLEYWFDENVDYGTYSFDVKLRELNYNTYYHKKIDVNFIEDTDTTPPIILISYIDGDGTDGNSGVWDIFAYDRESVIDYDRIEVYINDILIGNSFGMYGVPVILGKHTIRVEVWNNDATMPEFAGKLADQVLIDDDIIIPSLKIEPVGCINDEMSGNWYIIAEDSSGILEIGLTIDGITSIFTQEDFGIVELVELFIPIDNQLGNHECFGYVTDADLDRGSEDRLTFEHDSVYCTIIDDDETPPTISYSYDGDGTDGSPGVITISAYDSSGLSVDPSGTIIVPNSLGIHEFEFIAVDNDSDRPEDSLSSIISISILIIDDDTTSPLIHITYNGNGLDNNPGCFEWMISDLDDLIGGDHDTGFSEISIKVLYESSEGLPNQEYILSPLDIGTWTLPPFLGTYTLMISATDNDDDRTLLLDSLTTELDQSQEIKDDDSDPPILSNLVILDIIHDISISFEAFDVSGIKEVIINIDDEFINTYDELLEGSFTFEIINYWIMEFGIHYIEIEVWDADEDRVNDPLSSLISGTFTTSLEEMKQYNLWEVDQLFEMIYESSDDCWQKKNDKATLINKLNELKELISENNFEEAYDKLLHDIKPKLTGLKTDENEEPWGNGVFKNPWVTCPELQEIFRVFCNEILTDITVLIQTISTMEYTGLNYFNTYNSIVLNVNGMGGIYGYNIFLLIGLFSIIPLFSYFRRKKK